MRHSIRIIEDGTMVVRIPKREKVKRVLIEDFCTQNGKLYYPESELPSAEPTHKTHSNTLDALDCVSREDLTKGIETYFGDLPITVHYDMLALAQKLPSVQPNVTDTNVGEITDKEHRGKPYYSFKYIDEDGEEYTDYFIPPAELSDYCEKLWEKAYERGKAEGQAEIIRCKDCKWWDKQEMSLQGRCSLFQMYPTGEWYCGNAKLRSNSE